MSDKNTKSHVFIFHGTEGHPKENWFPWLRQELEDRGYEVTIPQFPSPPVVPAKISEWFDVATNFESRINDKSIIVGHSLGGVFTLRLLEKRTHPIKAALFVGTPVGTRPIKFYDRDQAFSGFTFDWPKIKSGAKDFVVYQSDNDPYVGLENGRKLAQHLGVDLMMIPGAGHFNTVAGYTKFEALKDKILSLAA